MRRILLGAVAFAAVVQADAQEKPKADPVRDAMKKTHWGADSPYTRLVDNLDRLKEDASWPEMEKSLPALVEMRDMLNKAEDRKKGYSWKWGKESYAKGTDELAAAVKAKDRPAAKKAVESLSLSCATCHFYYHAGVRGVR